jgi:hypothetical protein
VKASQPCPVNHGNTSLVRFGDGINFQPHNGQQIAGVLRGLGLDRVSMWATKASPDRDGKIRGDLPFWGIRNLVFT